MTKDGSVTVARLQEEQRHSELQVLAQSALIGERAVAITRLVMMLMFGVATNLVARATNTDLQLTPARKAVIASYLLFSLVVVAGTQLKKQANPNKALWLPLLFIAVDAAFPVANAIIDFTVGRTTPPEIVTVTFALLICFSVARFRLAHVAASTALSLAGVIGVSVLHQWATPVWISFSCACLIALGLLIAFTNLRTRTMFVDLRRRENLSRFLPRQVVDRVLQAGGAALKPVQREVTILFSDLRNFTAMSEKMPPQDVLKLLDDYFSHMGQIVRAHEGMLNKFIGDGLLAVWGVPDAQSDHAARALGAARDMRRKLVELNESRRREGSGLLAIGIGVHTGVVAAGMLGGSDQLEYTVIGDAVNLASRIEGLTKAVGCDILASEASFTQGGARFEFDRVGEEHVKGRVAGVVLYAMRPTELS